LFYCFFNTLEAEGYILEIILSEFYTEFDREEISVGVFDLEIDEILIRVNVDLGNYEFLK